MSAALSRLLSTALEQKLVLLIGAIGSFLSGGLLWAKSYLAQYIPQPAAEWAVTAIAIALLAVVLAACSYFYFRTRFIEHRGAFFKRKSGGGFHQSVYCGACKLSAAIDSRAPFQDLQFRCKCGWVSSFNLGEFNAFFPTLKP